MLMILAVILGIMWLAGILVIHIASPLLHLLLLIALVIFIYDALIGRK